MGDCVESLAEVKVDNIQGSPFVYPGLCDIWQQPEYFAGVPLSPPGYSIFHIVILSEFLLTKRTRVYERINFSCLVFPIEVNFPR